MKNEQTAARFVAAIKSLAADPDALNNLESYLTNSFPQWLTTYASTPEDLTAELECFAAIYK